jgi:hypothetical protein
MGAERACVAELYRRRAQNAEAERAALARVLSAGGAAHTKRVRKSRHTPSALGPKLGPRGAPRRQLSTTIERAAEPERR